jgi:dolichyl-phosphate beta-glucosyltransferase
LFAGPQPRPSRPSEKKYQTVLADGSLSEPLDLPCWYDEWKRSTKGEHAGGKNAIEPAEVLVSVVVPAYNEEERMPGMLEEAVAFLEREYGSPSSPTNKEGQNGGARRRGHGHESDLMAWEIVIVSDGSTDTTVSTALDFARSHTISSTPKPVPGPRTPHPNHSVHISPGSIRVVTLEENRGKGGAVTHGMRHVRGKYVVFADADGATRFEDLGKMIAKARELESQDAEERAVVVGSRAHLVGSEAVVKVSRSHFMSLSKCRC